MDVAAAIPAADGYGYNQAIISSKKREIFLHSSTV